MKVQVYFKTPDAVYYALEDVAEEDRPAAEAAMKKFVQYGEALTVEFDTEAGTCVGVHI